MSTSTPVQTNLALSWADAPVQSNMCTSNGGTYNASISDFRPCLPLIVLSMIRMMALSVFGTRARTDCRLWRHMVKYHTTCEEGVVVVSLYLTEMGLLLVCSVEVDGYESESLRRLSLIEYLLLIELIFIELKTCYSIHRNSVSTKCKWKASDK